MIKPKQVRKVGIANITLDNSSMSNIVVDGSNSDADVGIFDVNMKDAHLSGLNISDVSTINNTPKAKEIKQKPKAPIMLTLLWKILIPLVIGIALLAIQQIWFK